MKNEQTTQPKTAEKSADKGLEKKDRSNRFGDKVEKAGSKFNKFSMPARPQRS